MVHPVLERVLLHTVKRLLDRVVTAVQRAAQHPRARSRENGVPLREIHGSHSRTRRIQEKVEHRLVQRLYRGRVAAHRSRLGREEQGQRAQDRLRQEVVLSPRRIDRAAHSSQLQERERSRGSNENGESSSQRRAHRVADRTDVEAIDARPDAFQGFAVRPIDHLRGHALDVVQLEISRDGFIEGPQMFVTQPKRQKHAFGAQDERFDRFTLLLRSQMTQRRLVNDAAPREGAQIIELQVLVFVDHEGRERLKVRLDILLGSRRGDQVHLRW